jgi:predicted ATPase
VLLRFAVSNHRSIMERVDLSMIAIDDDRPATRTFPLLTDRVLTTAGIYGANASGKSNVLDGLAWLSAAVRNSLRRWTAVIPREVFRFGRGATTPSTYEIEMVVNDIRYAYHLEVDDAAIRSERLDTYPERRRRTLFERAGVDLHLRRGLGAIAGARELLTPTTLALSAAMRFDDHEVAPFGWMLANVASLGLSRPAYHSDTDWSTVSLFQAASRHDADRPTTDQRATALALLRFAELGIDDVDLIDRELNGLAVQPHERLRFIHRLADRRVPFTLDDESAGTRTWFALIGPTLAALHDGRLLVVDEIDASLHPHLSVRLLQLFQDPQTNPRGAQLLFTTHDTSLLNHLNRDEVWFTEKRPDASTDLVALAEYGGDKVRRSLNLERAYLQGRFGAVPDLDTHGLRHALTTLDG